MRLGYRENGRFIDLFNTRLRVVVGCMGNIIYFIILCALCVVGMPSGAGPPPDEGWALF